MTDLRGIQTLKFYRRQGDWKWSRKTKNKSPSSPSKRTGTPTNSHVTEGTTSPTPKPIERPRKTSKLPRAQSTQCVQLTTEKAIEDVVPAECVAKPVHQCSPKKTSVREHRKRPKQSSKSKRNIDEKSSKVIETATGEKCGPIEKWTTLEENECCPHEKRSTVEESQCGPREKWSTLDEGECGPHEERSTVEVMKYGPCETRSTVEEWKCDTCKKRSTTEEKECSPREMRSTIEENKYGPREKRLTLGERKYGPRNKRSTVEQREYGPRGKRSIIEERKYGPYEKRSTVNGRNYGTFEKRSIVEQRERGPCEKRSTVEEREYRPREKRPTIEESKYGPYEKRSTLDEPKCAPCEKRSTVEERKHQSYEKRSTLEERRYRSRERRSNVEETKHGPFKKKGPHGGSKHTRNQCADPKNGVVPYKVKINQKIEVPPVVLDDIVTSKPKIDAANTEIIAKHESECKFKEDVKEIQSQNDKIAVNKVLDTTFVNTEDVAKFEEEYTDDRVGEDKVYCHTDVDSNIYQTDDWKTGRIEGIAYVQKEQPKIETPYQQYAFTKQLPKKDPKLPGHDKIMEELRKLKDFNIQGCEPDENRYSYVSDHENESMEVFADDGVIDRAWLERYLWNAAKPRLDPVYQMPDQTPDPQLWDPGFEGLYTAMPWRQACIPDLQKQAWSEAVGDGFWNLVPPLGPPPGLESARFPPASGEGEVGAKNAADIAAQWMKYWQETPPPGLDRAHGPAASTEGEVGARVAAEIAAQWMKYWQEMVPQPPPGLESRGPSGGGEGNAAEIAAQWMKKWQEMVPQPPPGLESRGPSGGGEGNAAELAAQWMKNWQERVPQPPPGLESRGPSGGGEGNAAEIAAQWMKNWQETVPQPPPGLESARVPLAGGAGDTAELAAQWMKTHWQETVPQPPPGLESVRGQAEGTATELAAQWMKTHWQETVPPLPPLRPLSRCVSVDSGEFMLGAHIAPHSSEKDLLGAMFANECREARRRPDPFGRRVTKPIQYNYYTDNICEDIPTRDVGLNEPYDVLRAVTETEHFKERNIEAIVAEPDLTLSNTNATTEDVILAGSLQNNDIIEAKDPDDGNTDIYDKKDDKEPKHDKNLDLMEVSEAFVESSDIDNEFYKAIVRALKKSNERDIERNDHDRFDINRNFITPEDVPGNTGLPTIQIYDECLLNNLLIKDKFPNDLKKATDKQANQIKQILTVDDLRGVKTDVQDNLIGNNMKFSDVAALRSEFDSLNICRGRGRNRNNYIDSNSYHPIHFMQDDYDHCRGRGRGRVNQVGCAYNKNFQ